MDMKGNSGKLYKSEAKLICFIYIMIELKYVQLFIVPHTSNSRGHMDIYLGSRVN